MSCTTTDGAIVCTNTRPAEFARDSVVAVGFGRAALYRDGLVVIDGEHRLNLDENNLLTGAECEALAARDPDHVWEIVIDGPLSGAVYRREGREIGRWVCIKQTGGFA